MAHSSCASTKTAPASRSSAGGLGKTPTTSVRRFTSRLSRSSGLVDQIFFQWLTEAGEGQQVFGGGAHHLLDLRQLPAQHRRDGLELLVDVGSIRLGEDRADRSGDHFSVPAGHLGEHVSQEVDPAALPGRAEHDRTDGLFEAFVGVGDHQLHPSQAASSQRT
jgi:hypothetical protein